MDPTTTTAKRRRRLSTAGLSPRALLGSARGRILGAFLVLLVFSTVVSTLALRQILLARVGDRVERSLVQEVDEFRQLVNGNNPETGEPFGGDVEAIFDVFLSRNIPGEGEAIYTFVDGRPYKTTVSAVGSPLSEEGARLATVTRTRRGNVSTPRGDLRYLAVPVRVSGRQRGVFLISVALDTERAEVTEAVEVATGVSLAVLLLASSLAFVIAGRVLSPLRDLGETAHAITESDLSRRIEVEGHDEITDLARTFNAMLDRLEAAFVSQSAFISDAGHELRTPITIIRGHLELLGDDPEERRETIELVCDEQLARARRAAPTWCSTWSSTTRTPFAGTSRRASTPTSSGSTSPRSTSSARPRGWSRAIARPRVRLPLMEGSMHPCLAPIVDELTPVGLDELEASAALLDRVDHKYVLSAESLAAVLTGLDATCRMLEIDGRREFAYRSTYFDTASLTTFRHHVQQRRRRYKVRAREYVDSGLCSVKLKGARGRTFKRRMSYDPGLDHMTEEAMSFLAESVLREYGHAPPEAMLPT